jgi:hypothetical protein
MQSISYSKGVFTALSNTTTGLRSGYPKVSYFDITVFIDENIRRLDVPMNDIRLVNKLQSAQKIVRN